MKTDEELSRIFAEGNNESRAAALRAVYDAGYQEGQADVSRGYSAFDGDGDGKPGGSKPRAKRGK